MDHALILPPDKGDRGGFPAGRDSLAFIPYDPRLLEKSRENRKNMPSPERRIWNRLLRDKQLQGFKFLRQKPLDRFIVDFYCAELLLAIEIDGDSHAEQKDYDELRTLRLNEYGIRVIRYTNHEVMSNLEGVYEDLVKNIFVRKNSLIKSPETETPPAPLIRGEF